MNINLENKLNLGASTLRQITSMPFKPSAANTTYHCIAIVGYEKAFDSEQNLINIDIIGRTKNKRRVGLLRNPERHMYTDSSVVGNSTSTQRQ